MKTPTSSVRAVLALAIALVSSTHAGLRASEVIHWNRVAVDATTRAMPDDPLSESRILAIVHLAMHDAANTIDPHYATYTSLASRGPRGASVEAAIAAAAHTTLKELLPAQAGAFDREFAIRVQNPGEEPAKAQGIAVGTKAALQLVELRKNDGATDATPRAAGTVTGAYRPTPPDFTPEAASHWGRIRPFALTGGAQFRPTPPHAINSREAASDIQQVRAIGGAASTMRTEEQSEIARFWYEHSTRGWNRIAREIAATRNLDVFEQARLLALVNVAMADGFIGGFEAKSHYHYWRPATAIRETIDRQWLSFLPTPPVPDYPSTHTVLGAAAATVIAECLGTDFVSFSMTSGAPFAGLTRRFWSLSEAAQENGGSRVLAGIHFPNAVHAGYRQGCEIGAWVAAHTLPPHSAQESAKLTAGN
jgi:hypothetical protein